MKPDELKMFLLDCSINISWWLVSCKSLEHPRSPDLMFVVAEKPVL